MASTDIQPIPSPLPRVSIQFCTQCKWLLRAAYYAQELLSTFSVSLGEVALQPSTGGTFVITIDTSNADKTSTVQNVLWDRKVDGGFPETKELKRRVRDVIEPGRDLGHVDRDHGKKKAEGEREQQGQDEGEKKAVEGDGKKESCEDCQ